MKKLITFISLLLITIIVITGCSTGPSDDGNVDKIRRPSIKYWPDVWRRNPNTLWPPNP